MEIQLSFVYWSWWRIRRCVHSCLHVKHTTIKWFKKQKWKQNKRISKLQEKEEKKKEKNLREFVDRTALLEKN